MPSDAERQRSSLGATAHRPWPLPEGTWTMGQSWLGLLFAHWALDAEALRPFVPAPLELDTFEGQAWLGVTPFLVTGLHLRGVPPLPRVSTFPEVNVRTYVRAGSRPGIWFLSLDAASRTAVAGARRFYRLPYFVTSATLVRRGPVFRWESARRDDRGHDARLVVEYEPLGERLTAAPGTLEHFLVERYRLYSRAPGGRLLHADIHHRPWELTPAEARLEANTMPPPGLRLPAEPPLLHCAARQDVLVWSPQTVSGT
ncbi:MAG TPA: DUF2071 domain-containing protein [Gaiellaceae bacterium]|nr:DUF2071 domain-containing protein [Gaiellaceae bacterium]